jgi:anti-anti-sigma factor
MSNTFNVDCVLSTGHTEVLRASGPLDARNAPLLLEHCSRVRSAGHNLVLNLEGVTLIASSGIGALLALVEEYEQSEQSIRITAVSPAVDAIVRLLNLAQFLPLEETEEQAITVLEAA